MQDLKYKAVIFDMDGVLIDSEPLYNKGDELLFNSLGIPFSKSDLDWMTGANAAVIAKRLLEIYPDLPYTHEQIIYHYDQNLINALCSAEELTLSEQVFELVKQLKKAGVKVAIASSSCDKMVYYMVGKFGLYNYLDAIITGDDVMYSKPYPEIYEKAAARLGVQPCECIAVEDSINGIKSSQTAGMKCIAYTATNRLGFDLSFADFSADSFEPTAFFQILRQ